MLTVTTELSVRCGTCSGLLEAEIDRRGDVKVELCKDCIADAKAEGVRDCESSHE